MRKTWISVKIDSMASNVSIGALLRHFATKSESALVSFKDFHSYVKRYAAKHLEEQASLVQYIEISDTMLLKEIEDLSAKHEVFILNQSAGKITIVVLTYYSVYFASRYKEMLSNITIPFPVVSDLPKQVPHDAIEKKDASEIILGFLETQNTKSSALYTLLLPRDVPAIIFPACVPIQYLLKAAVGKIRNILKKEEYHDYFLKKMKVANPNKEIGARGFFERFVQQPDSNEFLDTNSEAFYYWSQLCYFIRLDFEKVKDRTAEDTNILQAICITEIWLSNLKDKASREAKKQQALAELEMNLSRPPYFYTMDSILKFKDSKGANLYGQFEEEDLKNHLQKLTTEVEGTELPKLLVFKIESGIRYFIYKANVLPLIVRLSNEAHATIEKSLLDKWYKVLLNYDKLPEMKDSKKFELVLKNEVQTNSPVLYTLLNANFLPFVNMEINNSPEGNNFDIFSGGKLHSYSDLLMIKNTSILARAKMMLPFWYTIPIISTIAGLLFRKKQPAAKKEAVAAPELTSDDIPDETSKKPGKIGSKKEQLQSAAREISQELIPAGSTVDRELNSYESLWNKMITKEARMQLTDDVNCLIRDYMRKVIKTISSSTFTLERVQSLASTLVKTPNMQKIKEEDALYMYVQLYILKLVTNG